MKKVLVLLGSVLVAGCFICHKTAPQEDTTGEIVTQQTPVLEEQIITRYTIAEAAMFKFDSEELRSENNRIDEVMKDIQAHPDTIVYVEGHTDNIGTEEYNKELSLARARAVARELNKRGCATNRIRIYGAGSTKPIASNDTEEGRARNRRVDVALVKN